MFKFGGIIEDNENNASLAIPDLPEPSHPKQTDNIIKIVKKNQYDVTAILMYTLNCSVIQFSMLLSIKFI